MRFLSLVSISLLLSRFCCISALIPGNHCCHVKTVWLTFFLSRGFQICHLPIFSFYSLPKLSYPFLCNKYLWAVKVFLGLWILIFVVFRWSLGRKHVVKINSNKNQPGKTFLKCPFNLRLNI